MPSQEQSIPSTSQSQAATPAVPDSIPKDGHHRQQIPLPLLSQPQSTSTTTTPFSRSIRATFDSQTITLYQAYNTAIASAAVSTQNLASSPLFHRTRTTWLKPSWGWMLYRSGYSFKDPGQACVLALKFRHESFLEMLELGRVVGRSGSGHGGGPREGCVVVQWDPERDVRIRKVEGGRVRSIQIGVGGEVSERLVGEWVCGIEDVTWRARELKRVLDEEGEVGVEELVSRGLVPEERCFDGFVPESVKRRLRMNGFDGGDVEEEDGGGDSGDREQNEGRC